RRMVFVGNIDFWSRFVTLSRMLALSLDPVTATLLVDVRPRSKKSRTLFGARTHGAGWPLLHHWTIGRPSILVPQLRLRLSLVPPPLASYHANCPPEPCPYTSWNSGSLSGVSNVRFCEAVTPSP